MCIIGVYKKGTMVKEKELDVMWEANSDGAGFSVFNKETGKWETTKGIMSLEELKEILRQRNLLGVELDTTFVIHFRAATHGGIRRSLTHPFLIKTVDKDVLLYHNGVFNLSYAKRYKTLCKIHDLYSCEVSHKHIAEDVEVIKEENDEPILDPTQLEVHSDTSLMALYLSELNASSDLIVKLLNSPLLESVISHSRVCLCIEGEENPILIGNWIEDEGRFFSNSGYKVYDYRQLYRHSSITSYPYDPYSPFRYYDDDDYYGKSSVWQSCEVFTEEELEREFEKSFEKIKKSAVDIDETIHWRLELNKITGVVLNEYFFLPILYHPNREIRTKCKLLVHKGELYLRDEEDKLYLVSFLKEHYDKYLKKYNFKKKIGIAADENFNLFYVQKYKGKIRLYPVKKILEYPVVGYFVENGKLIEVKKYNFIDFVEDDLAFEAQQ